MLSVRHLSIQHRQDLRPLVDDLSFTVSGQDRLAIIGEELGLVGVGVVIFAFYWIWQDFFQPLIFVSSPKNYTIPLALKLYTDPNSYNNYGGLFAMSVLSLLPVIIVFILFQKYIVEGIATDGIKG